MLSRLECTLLVSTDSDYGFASEYFPVELDEGLDGRGGGEGSGILLSVKI